MINHPVHIIDDLKNLSPSAFIPFCEFGGNLSAMGVKTDHFSIPVCNSFKAKIQNNQLCYEVDLNNYFTKDLIKEGLEIGLVLVIDLNKDRQVKDLQNEIVQSEFTFASKLELQRKLEASSIIIETIGNKTLSLIKTITISIHSKLLIEPIMLQGEGEYNLNVVKDVKVTESFMTLGEDDRGCQSHENVDDCTTRYVIII